VFQADEINAAPPEALMAFHGLLEDSANRSLELLEKGEVIEPHDDFMFVGTMNPPSFAGTRQMNDALKGRLIPIEVPYLEPKAEKGLLENTTDLDSGTVDDLVEMAIDIRSTDNVPPCTLRELDKIAEMSDVMGLKGAAKMVLLSQAETENEKDAINKRIDMLS
jgi:MoxR-like ATPase